MTHTSTILIVDDEPSARDTLEVLLMAEQDYRLAFAGNGTQALQKAAEISPDVVLLDVMMPDMDGFEVCRRLRADPRLASVPVILVTALDDRDSRMAGLEAGADDFISKPYDRAELRVRLRTITRLNRYRQLLAERARFEWVIRQASEGYLVVSDSDQVLYANPQARLYLGLPPGEDDPIRARFMELAQSRYHCEPQDAWATWPAATSGPAAALYLVQPESPTAKAFWLQVDLLDMPSGPGVGRLVRLRDVTAHMALRSEVWGFQSAINHKLRTPLTIMLNSLELQAQYSSELSPEEIAQLSKMTIDNINRLRSQVADILQYLNAPVLAESGQGFNLARLQPVVAEIGAYLGLKSVTVSVADDLAQACTLLSERGIELALWELLENAIKFHPAQAPAVEVLLSRWGAGEASLRVCDDGLSLSPLQLAQAWLPYYQGEKHFTGQVSGMGLGLPMVAALVWGVGGACHMYNREEGPGVVVELVLPLEGR